MFVLLLVVISKTLVCLSFEKLDRNVDIEDETGKKMKALNVFHLSIKYLKDDLLQTLEKAVCGITSNDILWVLTVPAIWHDDAKQFMREAAEKVRS